MEKSNFINLIVSIMVILAGAGFMLYGLLAGNIEGADIVLMVLGAILILYGIIRIYITNEAAKNLS